MALPGIDLRELIVLRRAELEDYFMANARYSSDSPGKRYAIRVGSRTLLSDDTHELAQMFYRLVGSKRATAARLALRDPRLYPHKRDRLRVGNEVREITYVTASSVFWRAVNGYRILEITRENFLRWARTATRA